MSKIISLNVTLLDGVTAYEEGVVLGSIAKAGTQLLAWCSNQTISRYNTDDLEEDQDCDTSEQENASYSDERPVMNVQRVLSEHGVKGFEIPRIIEDIFSLGVRFKDAGPEDGVKSNPEEDTVNLNSPRCQWVRHWSQAPEVPEGLKSWYCIHHTTVLRTWQDPPTHHCSESPDESPGFADNYNAVVHKLVCYANVDLTRARQIADDMVASHLITGS